MTAWGAASGALEPAVCEVVCGGLGAAARRVEGEHLARQVFHVTGLYASPHASLLTPAILLARVMGGLAITAMETLQESSRRVEDGPGNRTLTGEACQTACDMGQSVVLAAAASSCGASLLVDSFTDDTFLEDTSGLSKPALVCPVGQLIKFDSDSSCCLLVGAAY